MSCLHYPLPTETSSRSRERRRSHRLIATVIATVFAGLTLAVQAPVAGASSSTPDIAVVPFANDVFWFTNGGFSVVDPASPQHRPRCLAWREIHST